MNLLAMTPILQTFSSLSATATEALFSAIWQGTVLAVCVWLCLRLLPGLSAAARSIIWLNVFVLLALLHVLPVFAEHRIDPQLAPGLSHVAQVHLDLRWSLAVAAVWAALSLWRAAQLVVSAFHLHGMANRAVPVATDAALQTLLRNARSAELCTSAEVARPSVFGFFRPRILVPPALVDRLSPQELQQVVLHEMEHLHRGDDWTNLLQKIGLVLFPLNPVLLWVERRLCAERELACDDRVLRSNAGRKAYALCLTHLAEYSMLQRSLSLVLGAWERRPELVRRVQRILSEPARSMGRKPAMAATAGLVAGALGCTLALAHSPQLISFVPAMNTAQELRPLRSADFGEMSRELGGTPHLVKAAMPRQPLHPALKSHPVRTRAPKRFVPPQPMTAELTPPSPMQVSMQSPMPDRVARQAPTPAESTTPRMVFVLTEWTETQAPAQLMIRVAQDGSASYVVVPATYAVPTPNGWLILQI